MEDATSYSRIVLFATVTIITTVKCIGFGKNILATKKSSNSVLTV